MTGNQTAMGQVRALISQALSRIEMPSWRYGNYYGTDPRTTSDLLREALSLMETDTAAPATGDQNDDSIG